MLSCVLAPWPAALCHAQLDLYGADPALLNDEQRLADASRKIIEVAGMTLLSIRSHKVRFSCLTSLRASEQSARPAPLHPHPRLLHCHVCTPSLHHGGDGSLFLS